MPRAVNGNWITPMTDHLTRTDSERLARRRRARNWAMLIALVALCLLFYAITVVKMAHQ
jgi:hypothetical protein